VVNLAAVDPEVMAVVVYGSYARGEPFRDLDVCLVCYPGAAPDKRLKYLAQVHDLVDLQLFHELPLYVRSRVMKEGKIILNKHYEALFDVYWATIKEYDLFLPHYLTYLGLRD
jgi:predicted nucleotidyltransferase